MQWKLGSPGAMQETLLATARKVFYSFFLLLPVKWAISQNLKRRKRNWPAQHPDNKSTEASSHYAILRTTIKAVSFFISISIPYFK